MKTVPSAPTVDAWIALIRAHHATFSKVERALKAADLPPHAWYDLLWELERATEEGLRPFELEKRMLTAQPNISRLIDRIAAAELVERRPCDSDGRGQLVVITSAGRAMRKRMWPVYAAAIENALGCHLSDAEASSMATVLARLARGPA
jgi:DNA-binding MarR family transcriptional regulator